MYIASTHYAVLSGLGSGWPHVHSKHPLCCSQWSRIRLATCLVVYSATTVHRQRKEEQDSSKDSPPPPPPPLTHMNEAEANHLESKDQEQDYAHRPSSGCSWTLKQPGNLHHYPLTKWNPGINTRMLHQSCRCAPFRFTVPVSWHKHTHMQIIYEMSR